MVFVLPAAYVPGAAVAAAAVIAAAVYSAFPMVLTVVERVLMVSFRCVLGARVLFVVLGKTNKYIKFTIEEWQ